MRRKVIDIIAASRPVNVVLTALSVWIGFIFSAGVSGDGLLVAAVLSAMFICAGGNVFNDFFDRKTDRINKPRRPFAAGRLNKAEMISAGSIFFLAGIALSMFLSVSGRIIAVVTVIGLFYYNMKAKRVVLLGNVLVSLMSGCAFLYGGVAGGSLSGAAVPAVFAILFHFGRELLKDIEDRAGDRQTHVETFPLRYGKGAALKLASGIYSVLIVSTVIPYLFLEYSVYYVLTVLVGVDLLVAVLLARCLISQDDNRIRQANKMLKAGMVFGMIALLLK